MSTSSQQPSTALRSALEAGLERLATLFLPNELAFLAATPGVELPLRDKLAYYLHEKLADTYRVDRSWQAAFFPGAGSFALLDAFGTPRAVVDIRSAVNPLAFAGSTALLLQTLSALKEHVPVFTQWYHVFVFHLPTVRFDASLPFVLPGFKNPFADSLEAFQAPWLESCKGLVRSALGAEEDRLSIHALPAGNYYLTRHQLWLFLCGPFTSVDTIYQLSGWQSAVK